MPLIVEEVAGEAGLKKLAEQPRRTLIKIARCRELIQFALSEEYLASRRQIGLGIREEAREE
jgi:hypothetical protein